MKLIQIPLTDEMKESITMEVWRPYMGGIFRVKAIEIAQELNKVAMNNFDEKDVARIALARLWKEAFSNRVIYRQAKTLLKRYDIDPEIKLYNLLKQ